MIDLLHKCEALYNGLLAKDADATARVAAVAARESAITARENRCAGIESAQAVLDQAKAVTIQNQKDKAALVEEGIKFENLMREERQAIKNEEGRLAPLQDAEKQLATDRATLYAREEALKVEKRDFAARYIAKIKAHFANTGKEPAVDDIT